MNKSIIIKRILYILIPLALVAIVVIQLKNNKETTEGKVFQFDKEEPIPIEADTVKLENVAADFSYTGTFEPSKESRISAEIQCRSKQSLNRSIKLPSKLRLTA